MVERLIAPATVMSLDKGATLFRQGDPACAVFIVIDGWVKLYRITPAGEEAVIYLFAKGDNFAEAVAFTGQPYPAMAETASKARIVRISANHVIACIRDEPDIALAMIGSMSLQMMLKFCVTLRIVAPLRGTKPTVEVSTRGAWLT